MLALRAFFGGLLRGLARPKSVLLLYVANLGFGALLALPLALRAGEVTSRSPAAAGLLERFDPAFVIDFLRGEATVVELTGRLVAFGTIAYLLVATFLAGGVFAAVAGRELSNARAPFFAACGANLFPFLRVLAPAAAAALLVMAANEAANGALRWLFAGPFDGAAGAATLGWILAGKTLLFLALFALLVLGPLQYARARCVLEGDRRMLRGYLGGVALALRRPFALLVFVLLSAASFAALVGAADFLVRRIDWNADVRPFGALDFAVPPAAAYLVVAQATLLLLQFVHVARTAGFVSLYRDGRTLAIAPDPELRYTTPAPAQAGPLTSSWPTRTSSIKPARGYAIVDAEPGSEAAEDAR
jgi:hypothetical protein